MTRNQAEFMFLDGLHLFLPAEHKSGKVVVSFRGNPALKHLIEALGVPHTEVGEVVVNENPVDLRYRVQDGDRIRVNSLFDPTTHQYSPSTPSGIKETDDAPRFILDNHLGRLAAYLRMLGFDTLYRNDYQDHELAQTAAREDRILLTRDRRLLMRSLVTRGGYIRQDDPLDQVREVAKRYGLKRWVKPFHRCLRCNQCLAPVSKEEVVDHLEPLTRMYFEEFHRCPGCGQVYWKGSHYIHMLDLVKTVLDETEGRAG